MTDMMIVLEDLILACDNKDSFDDSSEEALLEYLSSSKLMGWKLVLVWVWSLSIPQGIVCGMLKPTTYFCFKG